MNWLLLIVAGLFEVGFTACLGKARTVTGNASSVWYTGFVVCLIVSMLLLMKVTRSMPVGTAYAVWTGIGAVGTVLVGILFLDEPVGFRRLFFIVLLIASVVGLKLSEHS